MTSKPANKLLHLILPTLALSLMTATATWGLTTSATPDTTCGGYRASMICSAGEFTVTPQFSAEVGTPPYCVAGQYFWFKVVVGLSGVNTKRYNIGFYAGQQGNDPTANTAGNICSVAIFPAPTPAQTPWTDLDSNTCGDYEAADKTTVFYTTVDKIKVLCQGDPTTGSLQVPYALSYQTNAGNATSCTQAAAGTGEVKNESPPKCNKGTSNVSGSVQVYAAAYIDVTKVTVPANDPQEFGFTATSSDSGAKISVLTNPTAWAPTPDDGSGPVGGTYTPLNYTDTSGTATIGPTTTPSTGVSHGKKARFYINAIPTGKTMTITEAAVDGWETTADISCTNATAVNSTRTITTTLNPTTTSASCTITNTKKPRIRLEKTSNNGTGTFTFTLPAAMTATTDTIITTSAGATKPGSTTNYVNDRTQDIVITETAPADWPADPVSATCSDANSANSGNPASLTVTLSGNQLTIPKGYLKSGADIVCSFTNTKPTVQIRKTSTNGTGDFSFAGTNGVPPVSFTIQTTTAGEQVSGSIYPVTSVANDVTVTETPPADWPANPVSATCSDTNNAISGNPASLTVSLSGNQLTIPKAYLLKGAQIVCDFTNTKPTVQIRKTSTNGTGSFAFAGTNGVAASFSITTATDGVPVAGSVYTVTSVANDVTVTETPPAAWPANPVSATCSDTNNAISGNPASLAVSLSGNQLTIPKAYLVKAARIVCDIVNTKPTVQIRKTATNGTGSFGYTMTNLSNGSDSISATSAGTPFSGITSIVSSVGSAVTITEASVPTGWPADPVTAVCSDSNGAASGNGAATFGSLTGNVLTIPTTNLKPAAQIVCDFTNTRPTVQIRKNATNGNGSFGFTMTNLASTSDTIATTAGTPTNGITSIVTDTGTTVTITEASVPTGWPANPVAAVCSDSNGAASGNGAATFGSLTGNVLTIPTANLKPAAQIVCTVTNTLPQPTVQLQKTSFNGTGSFSYAMTNLSAATATIVTTAAGSGVTSATATVTSTATDVTITETVPAGWPANPVTASCTDSNGTASGNGAGTFGSLASNVLTISSSYLKPGATIRCSFVNTKPTVQISKTSANGSGSFGFTMTNLASASDTITTAAAGTPVSGATNIVTSAGTAVTITETTVPSGWPANPTAAVCSDTNGAVSGNGAATFGSLAGNVLTIPAANLKPAAQIVCSVTNTLPGQPLLSVVKFANTGSASPGQTVLYTIQVSNSGTADGKAVLLTDDLSIYTAFGVTTYPSTGTPFNFTDSGSGLTFGTPEYYIPASGWSSTTPADDGGGFNNSVTKWRLLMNGSIVPGGGFTLNYRTRVK